MTDMTDTSKQMVPAATILDMKTNLWDVRMHLHDMILRGLVRLVGDGVYAAVPEWQRVTPVTPVPQDACEHEEV